MSIKQNSLMGVMLWLLVLPSLLWAELVEFDVSSGITLQVDRFDSDNSTLLLWLPSSRGFERDYTKIARATSDVGQAVWVADLHESYMIPTGRKSIEQFDSQDVLDLIHIAGQEGYQQVAFFAGGRGVQLALNATREWQQGQNRSPRLVGTVAQFPHLLIDGQGIGEKAIYLPIARATNMPVYYIQPEFSTKFAHREEIIEALESGGAPVYRHELKGIMAGFHVRPEEELTELDIEAKKQLPSIIRNAVKLISLQPLPKQAAALPKPETPRTHAPAYGEAGMKPFSGDPVPPELVLQQMGGDSVSMEDWKGETVLLNFWATWCGPCVREIPSLARLQERMKDKPFRIISVNIGEDEQQIETFAKKVPIEFPVLLDEAGTTARDWKVYAYPSNYLLSPDGKITHAYRGALEWDEPEVVASILGAMEEH